MAGDQIGVRGIHSAKTPRTAKNAKWANNPKGGTLLELAEFLHEFVNIKRRRE